MALAAAACLAHAAEEPDPAQERIKAAFLSKFPAYVQWPERAFPKPDSALVIGVAGSEPIARELAQAVVGRSVGGHPMQVHRIAPGEDIDDCCHVVYVGAGADRSRTSQLLTHASGRPVLTVTEADDHPPGSVINFLVVDNHVRFDISRPAAERNGLQLRSQLLAVARQALDR